MFGNRTSRWLAAGLFLPFGTVIAQADVPWAVEDPDRINAHALKVKLDWVPSQEIPFWFQYNPELGVLYGFSNDLEFRMKFTNLIFSNPQTNELSGMSDPKFGFKYQIAEGRQGEVFALDYVITPAKNGQMMNLQKGKHSLALLAGWQGDEWGFFTQTGFEIAGKTGYDTPEFFAGVLAIYQVDEKRSFGFEVFGHGGRGSSRPGELFWAIGAEHKLSKDFSFEGRYSASFDGRPDELFAGLRWRLPNPGQTR